MRKIDWNSVQEATEFENPAPGAYIASIWSVTDVEAKEYLQIEWDFAEGEYMGDNYNTWKRAGFWPYRLIRSYKEKALPFFKSFKNDLEASNRGYTFDEMELQAMRGKKIGVVLGEEEYQAKDGSIKKRLYVHATKSVDAIAAGDFKIPALKKLAAPSPTAGAASYSSAGGFQPYDGDDGGLPWEL